MANEKRLIDANALLEDFGEEPMVWSDTEAEIQERNDWHRYRVIVKCQPIVDAVEVPCRCKECKYWKHFDHLGCTEFVKVCTLAYYMIGENGYCLYGERREGE